MNYNQKDTIGFLTNPLQHILQSWDVEAQRITQISPQKVQDAIGMRGALEWLIEYCTCNGTIKPIMIAHNAPFDRSFIEGWIRILQLKIPDWDWLVLNLFSL